MRRLSPKQDRILAFVQDFFQRKGYLPSIREIRDGCQISSTSVVHYNLKILEREGHFSRDRAVSRGIRLPEWARERRGTVRVPLIGRIAAGEPIPVLSPDSWTPDLSEALELTEDMTQGKEGVYALKVSGTSMIDALIDDGDIVVMQRAETAEEGEMVALWLKAEKEATLKRLYREGHRLRLQPANRQMQPIYADPDNVEVQGRVIAVIRRVE